MHCLNLNRHKLSVKWNSNLKKNLTKISFQSKLLYLLSIGIQKQKDDANSIQKQIVQIPKFVEHQMISIKTNIACECSFWFIMDRKPNLNL